MSRPLADTVGLAGHCKELRDEVARLLRVKPRQLRVQIVDNGESIARTRQRWPPDVPTVLVSRDNLRVDVLAHEFAHCLVPSRWLLIAEGLATWAACVTSGNCRHLLFAEQTLEEVLRNGSGSSATIRQLAQETTTEPALLDAANFHRLTNRLAYAAAGSFCGYVVSRYRGFIPAAAERDCPPVAELLEQITGLSLECLERRWIAEVILKGGPES